jgi:AhpD family alkylhydroperoxidase
MRLRVLDEGHGFGTKALFALIRAVSGHPILDVIKLTKYRPDFYGKHMGVLTQEVMRGRSEWSVGDRELMAARVAQANQCRWCTKAHSEVAQVAYRGPEKVAAGLADLDSAAVAEPLRTTLRLLEKLCQEHTVSADDLRGALRAGATRLQLEEAFAVAFAFNVTGRLADAFGFEMATDEAFAAGAKYLAARGYRG